MHINKILKISIVAGIFLIPFVPLIVASPLFFPFITGKAFAFRIIVELIFALYLVLALRDSAYRPKFSPLLLALGAFLVVVLVADLGGANPFKSFWSNFERMEGYITLIHLGAYFLVLGSVLHTEKLWRAFWNTSIGVSAILGIYGIFQVAGVIVINQGGVRLDGTFGNAAYLGGYAMLHLFLTLYLLSRWYMSEHHNHSTKEVALPGIVSIISFVLFCLSWYVAGKFGWSGLQTAWSGVFSLFLLPIVYVFWKGVKMLIPLALSLAVGLQLFMIFETATRGATLGLAIGLTLSLFLLAVFERKNRLLHNVALGALILIIACVGLFVAGRKSEFVKRYESLSRLAPLVDQLLSFDKKVICEGEFKSRCLLWPVALKGVAERPLLGWGQENFNFVFNKYYDSALYSQEQWFDRTHNVVFDWLIAAGALGLITYLSFFLFALLFIWRGAGENLSLKKICTNPFSIFRGGKSEMSPAEKSFLTGLLVAYFVQNLTVFDNIATYLFFFALLAYLHTRTIHERGTESSGAELDSGMVNRILAPLIIVCTLSNLYFFTVRPIQTGRTLISAISGHPQGVSGNIAAFKKALAYNNFGAQEIREQLLQFASRAAGSGASGELQQEIFTLAKSEMQKQIDSVPEDARHYLFMGSFLNRFRQYDEAMTYIKKADELSPNKPSIFFEIAGNYINQGKFEDAFAISKKAYDMAPASLDAKIIYAIASIYAGKMDTANQVIKQVYGDGVPDDDRLLKAFYDTKNFPPIIAVWEKRVAGSPQNASYRLALAAAYLAGGNRSSAVLMIQKAIELDPKIKEQGEYYIKEIKAGRNP